jgi:hypothetical protein
MKHKMRSLMLAGFLAVAFGALVGCASAGRNFDESKVAGIAKGQTTEADLTQMFGPPQNRSTNSEGMTTLMWMYSEMTLKPQSFIPIAGPFIAGADSRMKMLSVILGPDGKVTHYTSSGGGTDPVKESKMCPRGSQA